MGLALVNTHAEVNTTLCVLCTCAMGCFALAKKGLETTAPGYSPRPTYGVLSCKVKDSEGLQDERDTCSQLCASVRRLTATV